MVPENKGQNTVLLNEKLNHENMLNQVSSLVNMRNAKKLAQKGALQTESSNCSQKSPLANNQNELDKISTNATSGNTMGQSFPQVSQEGQTCLESPGTATQVQCDSVRSNNDQTNPKIRSETREVPTLVAAGTMEPSNPDSCSEVPLLTTDIKSGPPMLKRIVRSDGLYFEALVE